MENSATFHIIGLTIRTSNQEQKVMTDIPALWQRFMAENIMAKIPNKISSEIYCIYTEYEGDHNLPYTTFLGCKVANLDQIPEGMRGMTFNPKSQKKFVAKGNLQEGAVTQAWCKIWESDLNRSYTFNYEVYGEKAQDPEDAEVDIFVSVV